MWPRLSSMLMLGCLCVATAGLAQDPTKVEPKHYKLAFENEHVQVLYIHYGPHEHSTVHDHIPGVVVNVSEGHLRFTDAAGKTQEIFAKPGEARWFPALTHKVENLGGLAYDGVYIGIKDDVGHYNVSK
jgi:hypothetical protein